jgi:group I intron endonuclease
MTRTKVPKTASGIYQIQSKSNNKIYVGSAVNLKGRKYQHFWGLKNKQHCNIHLQNHVNKYGKIDLQFSILEFCPKESLIEREQFYIDTLQPEFNICQIAGSNFGIKLSEEIKQKISKAMLGKKSGMFGKHQSEETKQKMSLAKQGKNNPNYGRSFSKETRQKMSERQKGEKSPWWGNHHSKETKQKMSKAHLGEKNSNYGKPRSEKTKQKISEAKTGQHHSEETKQKLRIANLGKKLSEETKQKMSMAHKKRTEHVIMLGEEK